MATVSRKPTYSVRLPPMANCETCNWYREGKTARIQAGQHFAETNGDHYIRLNQDRTTVWEPARYQEPAATPAEREAEQ